MNDYVIGDIQGCYRPFMNLLETIHFNENQDKLWLVGDLVNRGPDSLSVLRFVYTHAKSVIVTLGNHDLYLLVRLFLSDLKWQNTDDTIDAILKAPDREILGNWLRQQKLLHRDAKLNVVMSHAGIAPLWSIDEASRYAQEVESMLKSDNFKSLLASLFGNEPTRWSNQLKGMDRLRCIVNYFTRMRFCSREGGLCLSYKGTIEAAPDGIVPWFDYSQRVPCKETIVFGHWAALGQLNPAPNVYALDTGCVWGQSLTAMRLQDNQFFRVRNEDEK